MVFVKVTVHTHTKKDVHVNPKQLDEFFVFFQVPFFKTVEDAKLADGSTPFQPLRQVCDAWIMKLWKYVVLGFD